MDAVPSPTPAPPPPATPPPALATSWPRSAQLTLAFLLGACTALLLAYTLSASRWTARPAALERSTTYRVDINSADRAELLQLPGVGESMAERIEEYRRAHGPFRSVDDLASVQRVGPAELRRLRPWVCVREGGLPAEAVGMNDAAPVKSKPAHPNNKAALLKGRIDINRATLSELQRVPMIGPTTAQRIIEERQKRRFGSVNELRRVRGIGVKKLEKIRPYVTVGSDSLQVAVTVERP